MLIRKNFHPTRTGLFLAAVVLLVSVAVQPAVGADFLLTWKASTDPDLSSYGIYQRRGDSAYVRIEELPVEELDDPAEPSYLVAGLEPGSRYTLAVTAVFASGGESDFFARQCIRVDDAIVDCGDTDDGATIFVSCFISAAAGDSWGHRAVK
jgi:hypothetical protein